MTNEALVEDDGGEFSAYTAWQFGNVSHFMDLARADERKEIEAVHDLDFEHLWNMTEAQLMACNLETLLNALPQNCPIYRDSGCWTIRDDNDNVLIDQWHNESFKQMIVRYIFYRVTQ